MTEAKHGDNYEIDPELTESFIGAVRSVMAYNSMHVRAFGNWDPDFEVGLGGDIDFPAGAVAADRGADRERGLLALSYAGVLSKMGVVLLDRASNVVNEEVHGEVAAGDGQVSPLVMLMTSSRTFRRALYKLAPAASEQGDEVGRGVNLLLATSIALTREAYHIVDAAVDDDERQEAQQVKGVADKQLDIFLHIRPDLQIRGYDRGYFFKTMTGYTAHRDKGTLAEYTSAEAQGLYNTEFGPDQWQTAMDAGMLSETWSAAFEHLRGLRDREPPTPLFAALFSKLRRDFDTASQWLADQEETDDIIVRKAAVETLRRVWEEDFPFENTFYVSGLLEPDAQA